MKPSVYTLWPFHISLALLLLNDHIMKYQYPGWFSGKASDIAGIFLIVLVLRQLFRARAYLVSFGVVAVFTWWKSPLSQHVIDLLNQHMFLTVTRTVDYTDLLAFLMIPVANYVYANRDSFSIKKNFSELIRIPLIAISMFAIMGTSVMMPHHNYQIRKENSEQTIDVAKAIELIKKEVKPYGITCVECSPEEKEGFFKSDEIELRYTILDGNRGIDFDLTGEPGGLFLGGGSWSEMEAIQRHLQYSFGYEFEGMEFVIRLGSR